MPASTREVERLAAVDSYRLVGGDRPGVLDGLTRIAASLFEAPMASVTLVHQESQWFAGQTGLAEPGTSRASSFSARLLGDPRPLSVSDTRDDPLYRYLPHVTGVPSIRFYAGVPLVDPDGQVLGAVAVFDHEPRVVGPSRMHLLQDLSAQASAHLQSIRAAHRLTALRAEVDRRQERNDEAVSSISHEARTPIAAMLGFLDLLAAEPPLEAHRDHFAAIDHDARRLLRMIDEILTASE